jgi:hypothetical protein
MVDFKNRIFLVATDDFEQRRRAIDSIKRRILKESLTPLNTLTIYSKEIFLKDLAEKLFTVSFGKEKILIFKDTLQLSADIREFLFKNLKKILPGNYLILEMDESLDSLRGKRALVHDRFFALVFRNATKFNLSWRPQALTIEDFKRSIDRNDLAQSLYIMRRLFETKVKDTELGMQLLGTLIYIFSYLKSPVEKERCLKYLWEADRAIKEKGLKPQLALELFLVKALGN